MEMKRVKNIPGNAKEEKCWSTYTTKQQDLL